MFETMPQRVRAAGVIALLAGLMVAGCSKSKPVSRGDVQMLNCVPDPGQSWTHFLERGDTFMQQGALLDVANYFHVGLDTLIETSKVTEATCDQSLTMALVNANGFEAVVNDGGQLVTGCVAARINFPEADEYKPNAVSNDYLIACMPEQSSSPLRPPLLS
jgi:hypothetical protein